MWKRAFVFAAVFLALSASYVAAQRSPRRAGRNAPNAGSFVDRMMSFDKNKDGKLTKSEITDDRLLRLFDRADADKDGTVTKQELTALAEREPSAPPGGPGFGPPPMGGPGQILPVPLRQLLELSAEQTAQVEALQKEVDGKLDKILNAEQKAQLKQMRERGPGGFGPPGFGPPGFGPPGDGPPPPPE